MKPWLLVLAMACGGPAVTTPTVPPSTGEDALGPLSRALTAAGMRSLHAQEGFLAPSERETFALEVPEGCIAIVSATSRALGDLDVSVYDPEGTLVAEDVEPDAHPTVRWCGSARRVYVVLHAYEGAGHYDLAVWVGDDASMDAVASAVGGAPAIGRAGQEDTDPLEQAVRGRGFGELVDERSIDVPPGAPVRFPVALAPDRCVSVVASAATPIALRLETDSGVVDEAPGRNVGVQTCGGDGSATAVVEAPSGNGAEVRIKVLRGRSADIGGPSALWLGARRSVGGEAPALPEGWRIVAGGDARWAAARADVLDGCGRLQVWVLEGSAELELRVADELVGRGRALEGDACNDASLVTDTAVRVAWRWLSRATPSPPPTPRPSR